MRNFLFFSFLALSVVSCSSHESTSATKVVDSHDMTLELESGIYSESASLSEAIASITVDKTGEVFYRLQADLKIGDLGQVNLFRFQRILKMNPRFVVYSTYKSLGIAKPEKYQERGMTLANITKISEDPSTGLISLNVFHIGTGLNAIVVIKEGRKGLVNVESIKIDGQAHISVPDPQERQISSYQSIPYWPYEILKVETLKHFGVLEGSLSVKNVR